MKKIILVAALGIANYVSASNGFVKNSNTVNNIVLNKVDNIDDLICRTSSNFMPCNGGSLIDDTTCGNSMEEIKQCEYINYWLLVEFNCGPLMAGLFKSLSLD